MRVVEVSGHIFPYQTGRFPRVSIRGYRSVMVLYDYDINAILTDPFKNHTTQELVRAQTRLIQCLLDLGLKPSALRIYNECPKALQIFFRENSIYFQICLPNGHRKNQAEKAIETQKCLFLSGISGVDTSFTMRLWCRLLSQATQTLKFLHKYRINPRLSAEAWLNGGFHYNNTPMAQPGMKILIHETPQ